MDNQWYERSDGRPARIRRPRGEAAGRDGEDRAAVDEERAFGPPRGAYEPESGIGEALGPEAAFADQLERQRYWDGYNFGAPAYGSDAWYDALERRGMFRPRPKPTFGHGAGPYVQPGMAPEERGFWDRMSDEAASWFGDRYARARREADHRGLGPKGYHRSDERIGEDVNDRLTEDRHLDASGMTVAVKDGEVTLDGVVRSRHDKHRAEHIAEHVSGVGHVQNNLRIGMVEGEGA
ncbi:BON domain-containing protein [Phenylobacterium sp.]|uniref:BON domain-containing protein n=1 Tax=Phenylobacterium sp. TaxID=1871053 RepID=UPI0035B1EB47